MTRDELAGIVAAIAPCDDIETAHRADVLAWIDSGAEIYRLEAPATPPKHLVVYAVIVDEARSSVFLIEHRKAGLWLPTGGHVDPGEHPFAAARRELLEETGRTLPALSDTPLLLTVTETVGNTVQRHTDVTFWYGFTAAPEERFILDPEECGKGSWFDADALGGIACDPHLARFMRKVAAAG